MLPSGGRDVLRTEQELAVKDGLGDRHPGVARSTQHKAVTSASRQSGERRVDRCGTHQAE